jgi:hypothetical protein
VRFANRVAETAELNVFSYRNFYNGGGVALGDLTGDGLPEIVLTSNQEGARVYLNEGAFRFRDVTNAAGLRAADGAWTTGVTLADVNGDGRLDLYCPAPATARRPSAPTSSGSTRAPAPRGAPAFREVAAEYGVADPGYSDAGGLPRLRPRRRPRPARRQQLAQAGEQASASGTRAPCATSTAAPSSTATTPARRRPRFTEVGAAAGIHSPEVAFGLGVAVGDVNRDGWPDVYVSNDFFERDYLYVNRGDGTFAERSTGRRPR